jgi:hypothetical protein
MKITEENLKIEIEKVEAQLIEIRKKIFDKTFSIENFELLTNEGEKLEYKLIDLSRILKKLIDGDLDFPENTYLKKYGFEEIKK